MALRGQPYIPLYVQDFMTDEKLNMCSAESTGVYIRLMCIMHKSQHYGSVLLKQKDKQTSSRVRNFAIKLQKQMPYQTEVIERALEELIEEEVLTIDGDTLSQKRMVRDGIASDIKAAAGKKGGEATQANKSACISAKAKPQAKPQAEVEANAEIEIETATAINSVNKSTKNDTLLTEKEMEEGRAKQEALNSLYSAFSSVVGRGTESDRFKIDEAALKYPIDWIAEAIRRTGSATPERRDWRYINKMLRDWEQLGHMDEEGKPNKPVDARKQKMKWFVEERSRLLAEGRTDEANALKPSDMK